MVLSGAKSAKNPLFHYTATSFDRPTDLRHTAALQSKRAHLPSRSGDDAINSREAISLQHVAILAELVGGLSKHRGTPSRIPIR